MRRISDFFSEAVEREYLAKTTWTVACWQRRSSRWKRACVFPPQPQSRLSHPPLLAGFRSLQFLSVSHEVWSHSCRPKCQVFWEIVNAQKKKQNKTHTQNAWCWWRQSYETLIPTHKSDSWHYLAQCFIRVYWSKIKRALGSLCFMENCFLGPYEASVYAPRHQK